MKEESSLELKQKYQWHRKHIHSEPFDFLRSIQMN